MIISPQTIEIKIINFNKKYYNEKGYNAKSGEILNINVLDLPPRSGIKILCECDYCNKKIEMERWKININNKISCKDCSNKKRKETNLKKYGVENISQSKEIKDKKEQTCLKNNGTKYPLQNKEILNKLKETNLDKYGTEYFSQTNIFEEKRKQTCLDKYGKEYYLQTEDCRKKTKETSIEKYGVEHPFQCKEIQEKMQKTLIERYNVQYNMQNEEINKLATKNRLNTMYKNCTTPCSKQQKHIHQLIGGELNYPVDNCSLDIAFPEEMIYIEYDGGGHDLSVKFGRVTKEDFEYHEIQRTYYLKSLGWKMIRIISLDDKLPEDNKILEIIYSAKQYLLNSSNTWIKIDIDNAIYYNSKENKKIDLGILRYIKNDII